MWVPGALKSQERASDPMAWELQNIVSHCTDADNQTCVLWKNSQGFNHWISFQPQDVIFLTVKLKK